LLTLGHDEEAPFSFVILNEGCRSEGSTRSDSSFINLQGELG
jgi:hypothetical protein